MISITLTDEDALSYIQNEKIGDVKYEELSQHFSIALKQYDNIKAKYDALVAQQVPPKVSTDVAKLASMEKKPSPFKHVEPIAHTIKYKSRLSKQDKLDLDMLAREKCRSNCEIEQFAAKRSLRPKTVATYINKHSDEQYILIEGCSIPDSDLWKNATIRADRLYIRAM